MFFVLKICWISFVLSLLYTDYSYTYFDGIDIFKRIFIFYELKLHRTLRSYTKLIWAYTRLYIHFQVLLLVLVFFVIDVTKVQPLPTALIHRHCWLSDKHNSQKQPTAGYKEVNGYQAWICQQEWKPPQAQYMHDNWSMLTLCPLFHERVVI